MPSVNKYLGIYLNDNLALMAGAQVLSGRLARSNRRTELAEFAGESGAQIDLEMNRLRRVMELNGIGCSRIKVPAVRLGTNLGRLKLNGTILRYSPLSRVIELEGLCLLAAARQRFWESLEGLDLKLPEDPAIGALSEQAAAELERLGRLRLAACAQAFDTAS